MSLLKQYEPTIAGYNQLLDDNLYLLEISRTVVMDYIFPKTEKPLKNNKKSLEVKNLEVKLSINELVKNGEVTFKKGEITKHVQLKELLDFCGIKLKSKKIKEQEVYTKIFNQFVKDIDAISYNEELGIMDEVVQVANVCLETRHKVIKYRAKKSKKLLFS